MPNFKRIWFKGAEQVKYGCLRSSVYDLFSKTEVLGKLKQPSAILDLILSLTFVHMALNFLVIPCLASPKLHAPVCKPLPQQVSTPVFEDISHLCSPLTMDQVPKINNTAFQFQDKALKISFYHKFSISEKAATTLYSKINQLLVSLSL